eukprot:7459-Heterococcus_DN1.PRE.2
MHAKRSTTMRTIHYTAQLLHALSSPSYFLSVARIRHPAIDRSIKFGADFYSFWWGGLRGLVISTPLLTDRCSDPIRAREQDQWLDQELEVAQLNAHHLVVFGHHPWYLSDPREEPSAHAPIPRLTRLKWLSKMGQCKVRAVFSGHLCSNLVHRMGKVDISPEDKKMGALAAELKAKASSEATAAAAAAAVQRPAAADSVDDSDSSEARPTASEQTVSDSAESGASPCHVDSDAEEVWVEEKVDMQHITTAAVAQGLRIARVYEEGIEHEFFALDSVPHSVELRPARDAPHSSSSLH